jgi:hypothetical protein
MKMSENKLADDIFGSFAYTNSDGSVSIDSVNPATDPNGKIGVPFVKDLASTGTESFYYAYICLGEIKFSDDFSTIKIYVSITHDIAEGNTTPYMSFYPITFALNG